MTVFIIITIVGVIAILVIPMNSKKTVLSETGSNKIKTLSSEEIIELIKLHGYKVELVNDLAAKGQVFWFNKNTRYTLIFDKKNNVRLKLVVPVAFQIIFSAIVSLIITSILSVLLHQNINLGLIIFLLSLFISVEVYKEIKYNTTKKAIKTIEEIIKSVPNKDE